MVKTLYALERLRLNSKVLDLGHTSEGRTIIALHISNNKKLPYIWIDAGIHAREWIAPAVALYVIDTLLSRNGEEMLQKYQFIIVPSVNPDGYEYSRKGARFWRKNRAQNTGNDCIGVDLNRNFPYKWGVEGSSDWPCTSDFRGRQPQSELETQAIIKKLTELKDNIKLYLTLHAFGQFILTPFGHAKNTYPKNYKQLTEMGHRFADAILIKHLASYQVGTASEVLYEAPGGADDFVSGHLGVNYSYTLELADRGRHGFALPPSYIRAVGRQLWTALQVFREHAT